MNDNVKKQYELLFKRYPQLLECKKDIWQAYDYLKEAYVNKSKLLIAGNGGSAADAEHIVGELMKGFKKERGISKAYQKILFQIDSEKGELLSKSLQESLPAIALVGSPALNTAYMNDCEPLLCFAQQVHGFGKEGDVLLAISTSGNSLNVIYAAITAKAKGMKVVALTGKNGGELNRFSDVIIKAPSTETYMIQEFHLPIYHTLCLMLEEYFFGE